MYPLTDGDATTLYTVIIKIRDFICQNKTIFMANLHIHDLMLV